MTDEEMESRLLHNHIHIFNLAFGCITVGSELAGKILMMGQLP